MPPTVTVFGVEGLPEIQPGADLATLIADACARQRTPLAMGDVLIVTQKIVSKAEGRVIDVRSVTPSALAIDFAARWEKDARVVEVALAEAVRAALESSGLDCGPISVHDKMHAMGLAVVGGVRLSV